MSYPVFNSWDEYVGTDGVTRAMDWSTPTSLRGQFQLGYLEALLQACALRYPGSVGHMEPGYSALEQSGGIGEPGYNIWTDLLRMDLRYAWGTKSITPTDPWTWIKPSYAEDLSGLVFDWGWGTPPTGFAAAMFPLESEILAELGDAERYPYPVRTQFWDRSQTRYRPGFFYSEWAQQIKRCLQLKSFFLCGYWYFDYPTVEFDYTANPLDWHFHPTYGNVKGDLYEILDGGVISKFYDDYEYGITGPVPRTGTGIGFHVLRFGDMWPLGI